MAEPGKDQPQVKSPADQPDITSTVLSNEFLELSRRQLERRSPYADVTALPPQPGQSGQPAEAARPVRAAEVVTPAPSDNLARARNVAGILDGLKNGKPAQNIVTDVVRAFKAEPTQQDMNSLAQALNEQAPRGVTFQPRRANGAAKNMEVLITGLTQRPLAMPLGHPSGEDWNTPRPTTAPQAAPYRDRPSPIDRPIYAPPTPADPRVRTDVLSPTPPVGQPRVRTDVPVYAPRPMEAPIAAAPVDQAARGQRVAAIIDGITNRAPLAGVETAITKAFKAEPTERDMQDLALALNIDSPPGVTFKTRRANGNARNMEVVVTGLTRQALALPLGHPTGEPWNTPGTRTSPAIPGYPNPAERPFTPQPAPSGTRTDAQPPSYVQPFAPQPAPRTDAPPPSYVRPFTPTPIAPRPSYEIAPPQPVAPRPYENPAPIPRVEPPAPRADAPPTRLEVPPGGLIAQEQDRADRARSVIDSINGKEQLDRVIDKVKKAFVAEPTEVDQRKLADMLNAQFQQKITFMPHRANGSKNNMEVSISGLASQITKISLGHPKGEAYK